MKKVFIISGASWAGKTTIYQNFIDKIPNKIKKIVTTTTRAKRKTEIQGEDYHFVDVEKFSNLIKNKKLIEYAEVHNNFYGSTFEELDNILKTWKIPLYIVDPQWVKSLKTKLSWIYDVKTIFILPPSIDELKKRLIKRWEDPDSEQFKIRINESTIWIQEQYNYDFCIVNNDLTEATKNLENIINQ